MPATARTIEKKKSACFRQLPVLLLAASLAVPLPAMSDDIEVYISAPVSLPKPNILFIMTDQQLAEKQNRDDQPFMHGWPS